ncbi:FliM/FliN family flagellar motor switch protein [Sphingomonas sp.]|uniref:FliM/FliN family flagellar motor switch protein n=1 Tax=Sphingomonas sp. TaxID=28214 RepID=UPI0025D13443|nr:flagellar motor switch protein FliM [Sphingomonas sp.]
MTALTRPNLLLARAPGDGVQNALSHVAARIVAPVSLLLGEKVQASSDTQVFALWQQPAASFGFSLGTACAMNIAVDDALAGSLLERQFGGAGAKPHAPRQCRATASRARQIADGIAQAIACNWPTGTPAVAPADPAQFARADDMVATIALTCGTVGYVHIAFAIEGLARISGVPVPRVADWAARLRSSALAARLTVRAILAQPEFPAATILRLAVGDVLSIPRPASVPLFAGAHLIAAGTLTDTDGRTAVRIDLMETMTDD